VTRNAVDGSRGNTVKVKNRPRAAHAVSVLTDLEGRNKEGTARSVCGAKRTDGYNACTGLYFLAPGSSRPTKCGNVCVYGVGDFHFWSR
jgi:hypothetical protein